MVNKYSELLGVIERFSKGRIAVAGDLIVDHYVWGKVSRISPEAPVVVVNVTEEDRRPGGAGNVARNLVALGADVSVCGVVGDDDSGRTMLKLLEDLHIDTEGVLVDRSRVTTVKTRVIAHAQQVVRIDREVSKPLSASYAEGLGAALESKMKQAQGVVISDYGKGAVCPALFSKIEAAKTEASKRSGAPRIPVLVDPKAPNFDLYRAASIIKPNRSEAEEASGLSITSRETAIKAARKLLVQWGCEMVLVTLGEDGMVLVSSGSTPDSVVEVDTEAKEVFDVSGAGDTVSAVFLLSLSCGATPAQAAVLANIAAGIVVAEIGTVAVSSKDLLQAVSRLESEVQSLRKS